jgi:hypothetical protein
MSEQSSPRLIRRFEEWWPSPWRGEETSDEHEQRPLRGAAGGHQPAGQYRSTRGSSQTLPAGGSRAVRWPFFQPVPPVRKKGPPFAATVVGVALTLLVSALCLGIATAPALVNTLILGVLR